jgi:hypothetical protein
LKQGPPPHQAPAAPSAPEDDAPAPGKRGKAQGGGVAGAFGRTGKAGQKGTRRPDRAETTKPKRGDSAFYEFSAEEADVDYYDPDEVVLDTFVREALLLEIPIFPLCSVDCPGIAPGFQTAPEDSTSNGTATKRPNPFEVLRGRLDDPKE